MKQQKGQDKRRRVLSPEGWQRLEDAIAEKFGEDFRDKPPFQKLSDLTQLPGERPLDPDTVSRIWHRKKGVYRSKIERLFEAVKLKLNESDHIPFAEDLSTEILPPDPKASAKPHMETGERNANLIEERLFRATEQLNRRGCSALVGIQALEEIAKDSPRYHWKIMELLAAFVRNAPRRKEEESIPDDIQAALTVIGRRDSQKDPANQRLNLSNTDITGAVLTEANLQGVLLSKANLQGVYLKDAKLQGADLSEANLKGAKLWGAELQKAKLQRANLERAVLNGAELQGAVLDYASLEYAYLWYAKLQEAQLKLSNLKGVILREANLQGANLDGAELKGVFLNGTNLEGVFLDVAYLEGVNLSEAKNLKSWQLETAFGDSQTLLPDDVEAPARWQQLVE